MSNLVIAAHCELGSAGTGLLRLGVLQVMMRRVALAAKLLEYRNQTPCSAASVVYWWLSLIQSWLVDCVHHSALHKHVLVFIACSFVDFVNIQTLLLGHVMRGCASVKCRHLRYYGCIPSQILHVFNLPQSLLEAGSYTASHCTLPTSATYQHHTATHHNRTTMGNL
eukprot:3726683-Amphidinium_carterae.2